MSSHSARPFESLLLEIEAELDIIWPGYTTKPNGQLKGTPFNGYPIGHKARIKWLLKRHRVLVGPTGRAPGGEVIVSGPWNRAVKISYDSVNPTKCYAHALDLPHDPVKFGGPPRVEGTYTATPTVLSAGHLAIELGRPLEQMEEALTLLPDGTDRLQWCRDYKPQGSPQP